ncbi:ABC transporter permease [Rheinheimera riviphila]|uniref:ABC transporter permease n=1 Tax=Rheinheimera riviphila TaxID=1834037 RepID=A0A437R0K2_9GAMM|nr:ABC transporter permease [Rheinheimera riviphila]RVU40247.1 ABC transporter permease [Rheinheimera riviphila]
MKIWTIALFEFKRYFKWKQELIGIGLMVLIFTLTSLWPMLKNALDKDYNVAVLATTGSVPELDGFKFQLLPPDKKADVAAGVGDVWDAVIDTSVTPVQLLAEEKASWQDKLKTTVQKWQQQRLISALPLSAEQQQLIAKLPEIKVELLKADSGAKDDKGQKLVSAGLLFLLALGVFSGFGFMFTAITTEKQNRVTEQLLTLLTPQQWMDGKILGISLFCLKSMLTSGLFFFLVIQAFRLIDNKPMQAIPMTGFEVFSALLFVGLGLLLVNSFMAGFAATIDDPNHSSRSIMMFLPAAPLGLAFSVMDNAEGLMMQILSLFPLTSFAAMPLRMANSAVPMWEWALSLLLLIGCLWWFKAAASRVFALGIRMYGKEPDWSDIARAFVGRKART